MRQGPVELEEGRRDVVTAVIIAMDGATRLPVRSGVDVQLWDPARQRVRPPRLIRNLSGQAVLLNEAPDQDLTFRIGTERSYYRGPVFTTFNPAQANTPSHVVALERRPDAPFDDVATLVRGVVVRPGEPDLDETTPVEGVTVSVHVASPRHQFPVTTDERGAFALIVDLRPTGPDESPGFPATVQLDKEEVPPRTLAVVLEHGRTHVFAEPVDLDGSGRVRFSHEPAPEPPGPDEPDQ